MPSRLAASGRFARGGDCAHGWRMKRFFVPNLERNGRLVRGLSGGVLLIAGIIALKWSLLAAIILFGSAAFTLFEAFRGWCVVRACGIKTKL